MKFQQYVDRGHCIGIYEEISLEKYFEFESSAERRHEFIDGKIIAMSYTSEERGMIVSNLTRVFANCLLEQDCSVYASDRMLYVQGCNQVYYPDLLLFAASSCFIPQVKT